MKIKKLVVAGLTCCLLLTGVQVNAKTLKQSFSGGSRYVCTDINSFGDVLTYKKITHAKTDGYYKKHYVRAYIGGSRKSASGAIADSGRIWSRGNVIATASTKKSIAKDCLPFMELFFPTGYAKYGK